MPDLSRVFIIIALILLSAFFSMTESALSYCNQIKLKVKAEDGSKAARLVLAVLDKFDKYMVTILICNNIVNILLSVLATIICVNLFQEYGVLVATIGSTLFVFIFGEMIPKAIGKSRPDSISCFCIYPIKVLSIILTPISFLFQGLINLFKKIFKANQQEPLLSEDDFQDVIESIEEQGQIEAEESEIIQSAVEFADLKVKEVMRDKNEIVAIDLDNQWSKEQLIDFFVDNNFSRFPVYKGDLDHIVGILHARTALKSLMLNTYNGIDKQLVEPLFVKPNMHLDTIFDEFKKKKTHIAIVIDKDYHTLGMVTMEDVLEELVGDIDESVEGGALYE